MSLHKSLQAGGKLQRARNVLTRAERIAVLAEQGKHADEDSVYGLPKVRVVVKTKGTKKKKKKDEEGGEDAAAEGDSPAADAS